MPIKKKKPTKPEPIEPPQETPEELIAWCTETPGLDEHIVADIGKHRQVFKTANERMQYGFGVEWGLKSTGQVDQELPLRWISSWLDAQSGSDDINSDMAAEIKAAIWEEMSAEQREATMAIATKIHSFVKGQ